VEQVVVAVGDQVQVFWKTKEAARALPAQVLAVEQGPVVRWRLQITGPSEASQRRDAVRARVTLPVQVGYGTVELAGETVDLSEAGLRATCEGFGLPPEPGTTLALVLHLADGEVSTNAEVARLQARGARWLLSISFLDLPENDGDRIRRQVFQALREERARQND
jgi:c-di-GMP-binding flagellar brake protein YcgR